MKKHEGITLLSLIITIVIIIILAGTAVAIAVSSQNTKKAKELKKLNNEAIKEADRSTEEFLNESWTIYTVDNTTE